MAYGDPYCGNCHQWMTPIHGHPFWICNCGSSADLSKDPNCHNPSHDHHDPESPIVLSSRAVNAAEEQLQHCLTEDGELGEEAETFPGAEACGHPKNDDGSCTLRVLVVDGTPFFDTLDELDEILEDTNQQVEVCDECYNGTGWVDCCFERREFGDCHCIWAERCPKCYEPEETHCDIFGHVWGKMGRVGLGDQGLSVVDWGPVKCLRCGEPEPKEEQYAEPIEGYLEVVGGPHTCPGCNLRDLTMEDAKEHIRKLLTAVKTPVTDDINTICLEARRFLRMSDSKIRAWGGD